VLKGKKEERRYPVSWRSAVAEDSRSLWTITRLQIHKWGNSGLKLRYIADVTWIHCRCIDACHYIL
jgi:hypothetical protein